MGLIVVNFEIRILWIGRVAWVIRGRNRSLKPALSNKQDMDHAMQRICHVSFLWSRVEQWGLKMPLAAMDEESIRDKRVDCDENMRSPGCEVLLLLLTSEFD